MKNYHSYQFGKMELAGEVLLALCQVIFTGILFFRSWIGCLFLTPLLFWQLKKRQRKKGEQQLSELRLDFREVILSIADSLHAGYALEQTISIALEDLRRLFPGEKRAMMEELYWMQGNLNIRVPMEQLFCELAERSGLEEIRSFASVLATARKQGGNLVSISREAADHINQRIQVQMEIEQVIAGKKLEKNIMFCMPYFILIYLQLTNPDYMSSLFHNIYGAFCMTVCLVAIYAADWWADRVIEIEV